MTPSLDVRLQRGPRIGKPLCTVSRVPLGLTLTETGKRVGIERRWAERVSGDAALAAALPAAMVENSPRRAASAAPAPAPRPAKKGPKEASPRRRVG